MRTTLGAAGIAVMLLMVAYLAARRRGRPKAPDSSVVKQVTPSSFELLKELNAHAGRLVTVFALVVAATSFSLAKGPIHDALVPLDPSTQGHVYGMLILLGLSLLLGALSMLSAMNPALPVSTDEEQNWADLVSRKRSASTDATVSVSICLTSLSSAWIFVYGGVKTPPSIGLALTFIWPAVGLWMLLHAERVATWPALLSRPRRPKQPWWRIW